MNSSKNNSNSRPTYDDWFMSVHDDVASADALSFFLTDFHANGWKLEPGQWRSYLDGASMCFEGRCLGVWE